MRSSTRELFWILQIDNKYPCRQISVLKFSVFTFYILLECPRFAVFKLLRHMCLHILPFFWVHVLLTASGGGVMY